MKKNLIAGLIGAGLVLGVAPAMAGEWRLDTRRCTVIDSRDSHGRYDGRDNGRYDGRDNGRDNGRYDRDGRGNDRADYGRGDDRRDGRYDRRDNRRGQQITVCPRNAWVYVPDRRELARGYDRGRGGYNNPRYKSPVLKLSLDRNINLYFRVDGGRKVYVR